uniref:PRANC domain-containing protein n=1 Tax=Trichogramma kaykai TaxID=54128 RepID=A0ABD2XJY3_9HYME
MAQDDQNCFKKLVTTRERNNPTLHSALACGRKKVAETLVRDGVDPNLADENGSTPLHVVCNRYDGHDLAEMLFEISEKVDKVVQVDARDKLGNTPLHLALRYGFENLTELLLRRGAEPNSANDRGLTPLHIICKSGNDDVSEILLKLFFEINDANHRAVQIDAQDERGETPLHYALVRSFKKAIELLLKRDASPNVASQEGSTPLHTICHRWKDDDSLVLLKILFVICDEKHQTVKIDAQNTEGRTPMHLAADNELRKVMECLLRRGANLNLTDKDGLTPLHIICQNRYDERNLVKTLFEICDEQHRLLQVDAQDKLGRTSLQLAVDRNHKEVAKLLLKRDANLNLADADGSTPLHIICQKYHDDDLAIFLKIFFEIDDASRQRVQVDARDNSGNTALHLALRYNNEKAVESLLRRGADPNSANAEGSTALHVICMRYRDDDFVKTFFKINEDIQKTVQVDAKDKLGRTPLLLAVTNILPNMVDVLLNHGTDLSGFVFPPENHFEEHLKIFEGGEDEFKLERVSSALAVVERLEKEGYELTRSDALTIMKIFAKYGLFHKSENLESLLSDECFVRKAKKLMLIPSLSLYDSCRLRPDEAEKILKYKDYFEFVRASNYYFLPEGPCCRPCVEYLSEMMSRGFFRRWALKSFSLLTHHRLPILCCEKIIDQLKNEELYGIGLAAEIVTNEYRALMCDNVC